MTFVFFPAQVALVFCAGSARAAKQRFYASED
jgi:hypothetical protein